MRPWIKRAAIATLGLAIAWIAPAEAHPQSFFPTPLTPREPTQIVQAPSRVGPAELEQLVEILESADGAPVVLRVPGSATIDASADDLSRLDVATGVARLYVVQQGDARLDGAAAILSAFALEGFRQPGSDKASGEPGDLWPTVERLTRCPTPCAPEALTGDAPSVMGLAGSSSAIEADMTASSLAEALDAPAADNGGFGVKWFVVGLLILIGALVAVARARSRRPGEAETPPGPDDPRPLPDPPPPVGGVPAPRPPAPTGHGRRARVVSVLDPEGYVELDRCLQRARWASSGTRPAAPGEWVHIEGRGKRLWAYAAERPSARAHQSDPNERRRNREPL